MGHPPQQTTTEGSSSLSPRQYYSVECTGMEERLVDCTWTIKFVKSQKKDAMVFCREGTISCDVFCCINHIERSTRELFLFIYNYLHTP